MTRLPATGPNAEQIAYWNDTAGPKWVAMQESLDRQIGPLGRVAMDAAGLSPGERVLDVGCGCGATSLEIARRVGPGGSVLGIDVSNVMLDAARAAGEGDGTPGLEFANADAQTAPLAPGSFDVAFSRFGVMFFADPAAAFANLRRALRPGGRLAFVCWQGLASNPWMALPLSAALRHMPPPAPPAPDAPGPFAFADPERVRRILEGAGFAGVSLASHDTDIAVGGGRDLDGTVDFLLQMGPLAAALRESDPALRGRVADAVREAVSPHADGTGGVRLASATWIVTAHAP